jgi:ubiquinone/menaquinone biosynthesis C-methylase UbiE
MLTYLLHPRIVASIPSNAKIADIGTGTGIWLIDLADTLPSTCTFTGYDTSSDQYPSASSLPSNVTLCTQPQSIFDEFPSSEQGIYDVVACRMLISIMAKGQWEIALKNVISLLKPGGWIQWIDYDASSGLVSGSYCNLIPGVNHRVWKEFMEDWIVLDTYVMI